jgi:hypothetical protein
MWFDLFLLFRWAQTENVISALTFPLAITNIRIPYTSLLNHSVDAGSSPKMGKHPSQRWDTIFLRAFFKHGILGAVNRPSDRCLLSICDVGI